MGKRKFEYLQIETARTNLSVFGFSVRISHLDAQRMFQLYQEILNRNQFVSFYFDQHHIRFIIICENKEPNQIDQSWVCDYENIELMSKISLKTYIHDRMEGISPHISRSILAIKSIDISIIDLFQKRINEFSFANIIYAKSLFSNETGYYISVCVTGNDKKDLKRKLSYISYEIKKMDALARFEKISTRFQKGNPIRYILGFTGKQIDNEKFLQSLFDSVFLNSSINHIKPMKWLEFEPKAPSNNEDQKILVRYFHYQKEITKILNRYGWILKSEKNNSFEFEYKKLKLKIDTQESEFKFNNSLKSSSFQLLIPLKQFASNEIGSERNILQEI